MRPTVRVVSAVVAALVVTRIVGIAVLDHVAGGAEWADDVGMHLRMAEQPLALVVGDTAANGQHPVLLPAVEAALLAPFRAFGDLWAIRLAYVAAEVALVLAMLATPGTADRRRAVAVAAVASPVLWMSTVVMAQDEIIAAAVLAAGLALWCRGHERSAVVVVGIGVAAAKVFLVLPLVALVLLGPHRTRSARLALGGAAAAVPYLVSALAAGAGGNPLPLQGFSPDVAFGTNLWVFAVGDGLPVDVAKPVSLVLALAGAAIPLVVVRPWPSRHHRPDGLAPAAVGAVVAAMLLWFFVLFYHSTPEYLVLVVPPISLLAVGAAKTVGMHVALAVPWVANAFYGISVARSDPWSEGKQRFVDLYDGLTAVDPSSGHRLAVWAATLVVLALAVVTTVEAARSARGEGSAVPAGDVEDDVHRAVG